MIGRMYVDEKHAREIIDAAPDSAVKELARTLLGRLKFEREQLASLHYTTQQLADNIKAICETP